MLGFSFAKVTAWQPNPEYYPEYIELSHVQIICQSYVGTGSHIRARSPVITPESAGINLE